MKKLICILLSVLMLCSSVVFAQATELSRAEQLALIEYQNYIDELATEYEFNGVVYIWRPIRRKEYRDIQRIEHSSTQDFEYYLEEQICNACVLWPEDYSSHKMTFGKAGIPTMLSQLIMERSGFLRPATVKL